MSSIRTSILFILTLSFLLAGWLTPNIAQAYIENFENGIPASWSTSGDGDWATTSSTAQAGTISIQSPSISHEQGTILQSIRYCSTGDITFYYKTSTEENNDQLQFYIDGELIDSFSGENEWTQANYPVTTGLHTFTWTYSKDLNFSEGEDRVWLDLVQFPAQKLSVGEDHSMYIDSNGQLWAWGEGSLGQLGDGTATDKPTPVQVASDTAWVEVACGFDHNLALKADGTLWVWGYGSSGALGTGASTNVLSPMQLGTDNDWAQIEAGSKYSLAIKTDGSLWGWGVNYDGQLGFVPYSGSVYAPTQAGIENNWAGITAGERHTLAVKTDGTLWAWGANTYSQLGDGTNITRTAPVQIGTDQDWKQISAGYYSSRALKYDGSLWIWGSGDLAIGNNNIPTNLWSETDWLQVVAGKSFTFVIKNNSTRWGWGFNSSGQLGDGTITGYYDDLTQIDSENAWALINTGGYHSLALKDDGTVWSWGKNSSGQLGDGTTTDRYEPTQINFPVDSDGDGIFDSEDAFPTDPAASIDTDNDGYPDQWNEGYTNSDSTTELTIDIFPHDSTEWTDSDDDGVGDNSDMFYNDPAASLDSDGDGYPDEWNDGYTQSSSTTGLILDAYPDDEGQWANAAPLNDTTTFVQQVYQDLLSRAADAGGLAYWVDAIDNQGVPRTQLVEGFLNSAEFGQTVAPVTRLYFAYFNRIPDYSGLMYWIDQYSTGASLPHVSDVFAGSAEFIDTYGSLSNEEFVTLVYQNLFDRDPDPGGLTYWTGVLDRNERTRGRVMVDFSESNEYKDLMANQIYVTMTYIGLLRRSPDQGGFTYWVGVMDDGGSGLDLIEGFLTSNEYAARFIYAGDCSQIATLEVMPSDRSISLGETKQYFANATLDNGSSVDISDLIYWSSSNEEIASIDDSGLVTSTGVGTIIVRANCGNVITASTTLTIAPPSLQSLDIDNGFSLTLLDGQTVHLTVTGTYSTGETADLTELVTWSVPFFDADTIAVSDTAGSKGFVTTLSPGAAQVHASMGELDDVIFITVE